MNIIPRKPHVNRYPERIFLHNKYDDSTLEFDIALIKINPVKITSHIKPISLPEPIACGRKRRKTKRGKVRNREKIEKRRKGKVIGKRRARQKTHKQESRRKRNPFLRRRVRSKRRRGKRMLRRSKRWMRSSRRRSDGQEYEDEEDESSGAFEDESEGEIGSGKEEDWCNIEEEQRKRIFW